MTGDEKTGGAKSESSKIFVAKRDVNVDYTFRGQAGPSFPPRKKKEKKNKKKWVVYVSATKDISKSGLASVLFVARTCSSIAIYLT